MGLKTLAQEVAIAMGKDECDDEVFDRTSDILKMLKATEFNVTAIVKKYQHDGTQELYEKVLFGRKG